MNARPAGRRQTRLYGRNTNNPPWPHQGWPGQAATCACPDEGGRGRSGRRGRTARLHRRGRGVRHCRAVACNEPVSVAAREQESLVSSDAHAWVGRAVGGPHRGRGWWRRGQSAKGFTRRSGHRRGGWPPSLSPIHPSTLALRFTVRLLNSQLPAVQRHRTARCVARLATPLHPYQTRITTTGLPSIAVCGVCDAVGTGGARAKTEGGAARAGARALSPSQWLGWLPSVPLPESVAVRKLRTIIFGRVL